jgi:UDP-N-acetylmuramate dehydrogenase
MTLSNPMPPSLLALNSNLSRSSQPSNCQLDRPSELSGIALTDSKALIKSNVSLASLTSFRVGGPAEWFVAPRRLEDLQASISWAASLGLDVTVVGAGSNLLVSDEGLKGLIVGTKYLRQVEFDLVQGRVTVGAGMMLPALARQIAELGWQGFEWAVGIPGTVGGAVVMNAGAHLSCIADILVDVTVLRPDGTLITLTPDQLGYGYRLSNLQASGQFVTQATFQLQPGADPRLVQQETSRHLQQRHSTQPYDLPSCGSVFRNPEPRKAAWLIEQAGLKGYRIGGAEVAHRHANFILNCNRAKAVDIFNLIQHVQAQVEQHWALRLEPEVRILGNFPPA